jgi:hypothetical protein
MSNLGLMFRVFLLSSFLAAATSAPFFSNTSETNATNSTNATIFHEIECESCEFFTHKIDNYIFHNERFMEFVKNEFDNICNLLPDDSKNICYSNINQTLPHILGSIGDFISTNGCEEIGVCHHLIT